MISLVLWIMNQGKIHLYMKRKLLLLLLVLPYSVCKADISLPSTVKVWQPSAFGASVLKWDVAQSVANSKDYGQSPAPDSNNRRIWIVFSDRDHNHVYESPSKTARQLDASKDLKLFDRLRIADIKDGFALVYEEPREATTYPNISEFAVSRGWVPIDHLVLWRTCPADEFGIYRKALLALNADKYQKGALLGRYYTNPEARTGGNQIKTGMSFYYIIKEDKSSGLTLLANEYSLDATGGQLYGWVEESSMLPWNQRSCLEPNWDKTDVAKLANQPAKIYGKSDMNSSSYISKFEYGKVLSEGKVTPLRMDGKVLRYPILDSDDNDSKDSYKCTYFNTIGVTESLDQIAVQTAELRKILDRKSEQMKQLNLIVVIDGTKSMEAFYEPVQKALLEACNGFGEEYIPRVGLVIYRDYADGKDDSENGLVEYVPLSNPKSSELAQYFRDGGLYHVKSSKNDHTYDEAVYNGIWTALDADEMGYTSEQSNLLVVIGDCGNDPEYESKYGPTQSQIIDKLIENNVHLLVFQVHKAADSNNKSLYDSNYRFTDQMNDILLKSMEAKYSKIIDGAKVRWTPINGGYDLLPPSEISSSKFYLGATRFPNNDEGVEEIQANELNKMLVSNIYQYADIIRKSRDTFRKGVDYAESDISSDQKLSDIADDNFIKSIIGEENAAMVAKSKTLVTITGYTPKQSPEGVDYWKPVIFISKPELDNLLDRLQSVLAKSETGGSNMNEVRKKYVDAMKDILRSMLPGITETEMESKTQEEVVALIAGLNVSTRQLSGRPLREISDSKICPDKEFNTIVSSFKSKVNKLKNVVKEKKAYIYDYLDVNCYWVPIEDLP